MPSPHLNSRKPSKRAPVPSAVLRERVGVSLVRSLLAWFDQNARDLPWRRTTDPYAIWISEVMLQQTQVKTVIAYWTRWMERFPDARALAQAAPQEVLKLWEGLGYYARARNIHAAAQVIAQKFNGQFPTVFEDVLALPGVGRYTAGAVCSIAFNRPHPIVDGNAARVLCRIFGIARGPRENATKARLWKLAQDLVEAAAGEAEPPAASVGAPRGEHCDGAWPSDSLASRSGERARERGSLVSGGANVVHRSCQRTCSAFNQSLMELGALVCTPVQPKCSLCPVERRCYARGAGKPEAFPARTAAARVTRRRFIAFIVQKKKRFLIRQRPAGGVNANFWEFPNIEVGAGVADLGALARPFVLAGAAPCCRIRHTITRYRIELEAYRAELPAAPAKDRGLGIWRTVAQMRRMPMASAHRRILEHFAEEPSKGRPWSSPREGKHQLNREKRGAAEPQPKERN